MHRMKRYAPGMASLSGAERGVYIAITNHLQDFPRYSQWVAGRVADDESPAYDAGEC